MAEPKTVDAKADVGDLESNKPPAKAKLLRQTFVDPSVLVANTARRVEAKSWLSFNPIVTSLSIVTIIFFTLWLAIHEPCDEQTLGTCSDNNISRKDECTDTYTWIAATEAGICAGCVGDDCETEITSESACEAQCQDCSSTYHPKHRKHNDENRDSNDQEEPRCPCPCPVWQPVLAAHCVRSDGSTYEEASTEDECTATRTWTVDPDADEIKHWNGTHFDGSHKGCPPSGSWFRTQRKILEHMDWSAGQEVDRWNHWAVEKTNWLQVVIRNAFLIVLGWCVYRHGDVKLARTDEESTPEYGKAVWFTMIFTSTMGVGLLLLSVAGPISSLAAGSTQVSNDEAQAAILANFHHFGLHAWSSFSIVALAVSLAAHRWGLPMSMKGCFYPLLGDGIFGWIGDAIDGLTLVTSFFGVCASLGFAALQVNSGLHELVDGIAESDSAIQTVLVWVLMLGALVAVITGVTSGMQWLCVGCFAIGSFVLACVFLMGSPWYLLAVFTQSLGQYIQWVITLGTDADAFDAPTVALSNNAAAAGMAAAEAWSAFYYNWWIALAPAAGIFIAKISKGRTIRELIFASLLAPALYCFIWMAFIGGATIELQRNAVAAGLAAGVSEECAYVESSSFQVGSGGSVVTSNDWVCGECQIKNFVNSCASGVDCRFKYTHQPHKIVNMVDSDHHSASNMWYALMDSCGNLGGFLALLTLVVTAGYFITTAAAGVCVMDSITSNGKSEGFLVQRCVWALLLASCATVLLHTGADDAFTVLMRCAAVIGLPFMLLLTLVCLATVRGLHLDDAHRNSDHKAEDDGDSQMHNDWHSDLLDILVQPSISALAGLGLSIVVPFLGVAKAHKAMKGNDSSAKVDQVLLLVFLVVMWLGFVSCVLIDWALVAHDSLWAVGWSCFFVHGCVAAKIRGAVRASRHIDGSVISDLAASVFAYPFVADQLAHESDLVEAAVLGPAGSA